MRRFRQSRKKLEKLQKITTDNINQSLYYIILHILGSFVWCKYWFNIFEILQKNNWELQELKSELNCSSQHQWVSWMYYRYYGAYSEAGAAAGAEPLPPDENKPEDGGGEPGCSRPAALRSNTGTDGQHGRLTASLTEQNRQEHGEQGKRPSRRRRRPTRSLKRLHSGSSVLGLGL